MRLRPVFRRIACPDCGLSRFVPLTYTHNPLRDEREGLDPEEAGYELLFKCVICGVPFKWMEHAGSYRVSERA
jgi:DNA-directed RNA polymerase subunit RPC12/RpoP